MKKRFEETELVSSPKKMYRYYVTGRGEFPYDMLRYDQCWPIDAYKIGEGRDYRSVLMNSYKEPTIDRWSSFWWSVGPEQL